MAINFGTQSNNTGRNFTGAVFHAIIHSPVSIEDFGTKTISILYRHIRDVRQCANARKEDRVLAIEFVR